MTTYSDFLDEYRDASEKVSNQREFDGKSYRKFLSLNKKFHKIEDINIQCYKEFLRKALNLDGHMHAVIVDDPTDPDYKIAILKNWQKAGEGKIDLTLAFPSDPLMPLYERIVRTVLNSQPIIDGYKNYDEMEAFINNRFVSCYEDVVQSKFVDYDDECGGGNSKGWLYYLASPNDQDEGLEN